MTFENQVQIALENIYISPLEACNLNCRLCYTQKTKNVLSNEKILKFVKRYQKKISLKSILFCGGEVFLLPQIPKLINELTQMGIFITIITNGTIDRLNELKDPLNCQLLVSLDGPKDIHDANRGKGNFDKSIAFIKKALSLGFPTEIMFLVTPESFPYRNALPFPVKINYITQKANFFNPRLKNAGLTKKQIIEIKKNYPSIPEKNFGCFQLSLQSNGLIYGCCESPIPIAKMTDPVEKIVKNFQKTLKTCQECGQCKGCCNPEFLCGYIKELKVKNCQKVIKLLQDK